MTLQELQTKANAKLADFWTALQPKQDAYFAKHGKYFQLRITNTVVDGADTVFEVRKGLNEPHPVDVDFEFNSPIPFAISVNNWDGATVGYSASAVVELPDGRQYRRTRDLNQVDSGWYLIDESE